MSYAALASLTPFGRIPWKTIGLIVLALLLIGLGWLVNGWRWQGRFAALQTQYAQRDAAAASAVAQLQADTRQKEAQAASRVAAIDAKYQKEISHAQSENERLRAAVRAGDVRLRIAIRDQPASVPENASTTGRADVGASAELDPAAADFLLGLATEGDDVIRQLTALQDYVGAVCLRD